MPRVNFSSASDRGAGAFPIQSLPCELQLMIWAKAYAADRYILEIHDHNHSIFMPVPCVSRMLPVPACFHAESLARAAVMKDHISEDHRFHALGFKRFWFDPERDVLYWSASHPVQWEIYLTHEIRFLMIRPVDLAGLRMRRLCKAFPLLKEIRVLMGGIDFDLRMSDHDPKVRYIGVDLHDEFMTSEVTELIVRYQKNIPIQSKRLNNFDISREWELLKQGIPEESDPCWLRNARLESSPFGPTMDYYSLDREEHHFIPLRSDMRRTWEQYCYIMERRFLGTSRWLDLVGDVDDGIEARDLHIAHTKEYYEAVEAMPKLTRFALVRLLGESGDLWREHEVEIGKTWRRPRFMDHQATNTFFSR